MLAWWDYFNDPGYTPGDTNDLVLSGLDADAATVTDLVPDYTDGSLVTDYTSAFTTTTEPIAAGTLTLALGEDPQMIEIEGNEAVPTVSEWGLLVMALLTLSVGTVMLGRRRCPPVEFVESRTFPPERRGEGTIE